MRLFIALELPWDLRERLSHLGGSIPGARWVPDENLHLTLRFIGEADRPLAEEIDHALAALRSRRFSLALGGIHTFQKSGRDISLYVAAERSEALERLQNKVEQAMQRVGLEAERRRFIPHVTLARLDGASPSHLAAFVQANNLFRATLDVMHFTLFSSLLSKDQPVYTAEIAYPLLPVSVG